MASAQKGDSKSGHWPVARWPDTKIVAMVEALGNLVRFVLLPGQRHDSVGVEPLIGGIPFDALLGDKAFDNDWLRAELGRRGASAVIPPKAGRARQIPCDFDMYKCVISSKTSSAILYQVSESLTPAADSRIGIYLIHLANSFREVCHVYSGSASL